MLIFAVSESLSEELRSEVKIVCDEAIKVFNTQTVYLIIPEKYNVNKAEIVDESNYGDGYLRDAKQIINETRQSLSIVGNNVVAITASDITTECDSRESGYLNFIFDGTDNADAIVSMARFMDLKPEQQKLVLAGLIMQAIGPLFGAAVQAHAKTVECLGRHCTDSHCVMQQGLTASKMSANMLRVAENPKRATNLRRHYFCAACSNNIRKALRH